MLPIDVGVIPNASCVIALRPRRLPTSLMLCKLLICDAGVFPMEIGALLVVITLPRLAAPRLKLPPILSAERPCKVEMVFKSQTKHNIKSSVVTMYVIYFFGFLACEKNIIDLGLTHRGRRPWRTTHTRRAMTGRLHNRRRIQTHTHTPT